MAENSRENNKDTSGASERKLWFRSDIIIILALLTAAAIIYFVYAAVSGQNGKPYCELVIDGEVVLTVGLAENKSFSLEQLPNVEFEIKDEAIAFIESDCPDKICIKSGYQRQVGQTAACLPNRAVIKIKTRGNSDTPDAVV